MEKVWELQSRYWEIMYPGVKLFKKKRGEFYEVGWKVGKTYGIKTLVAIDSSPKHLQERINILEKHFINSAISYFLRNEK